jgi:parallel beta-helix repeat protein
MIQNNHIHHIARSVACTSAGGSAIGVDSYYHGVKSDIVGNVVNDIGPAGCTYVQGIYVSTSGTIKNNLVYRVGAVGIHLWHDATDVVITNNTVTSSNFGMVVGGGDFYYTTAGANNVYVANNIIYDNKYGISEQGKTGTGNKYINNLVFQNPTYNISLRNGLKATGTISSNPLFKAYSRTAATPDYHLTTSSPAIGRGTATNAYPTDLDGKPRNASTGYDLGAYQH